MPRIEQNRKSGQEMVNSGELTPASSNPTSLPPIPVTVTTYPAAPNPNLRGPLPASYVQQPDMQRQWQNAAVPQTRVPPSPSTSNPVVGAQAVSQTITVIQQGGGGGGTVLQTNGVNNTVQSRLNQIGEGGVNIASDSQGGVTFSVSGFVSLNPTNPQTISGAPLILASTTPLEFQGATSGATTVQAAAVASGTLTLPAATDTLVGKNTTDTLTNKTLTSPVLNGTPTGTALQGTDTKLLTSGTVSGVGATLCTDANGGATTTGCSGTSTQIQFMTYCPAGCDVTGTPCTTTNSSYDQCSNTISWPSSFASASYTVTCSGVGPSDPGNAPNNGRAYLQVNSKAAGSVTVITVTTGASAIHWSEIDCIGMHV